MTQSARTPRHQAIAQGDRTALPANKPPVCSYDEREASQSSINSELAGNGKPDSSSEAIESEKFELLSAYIDGETSVEEQQQVEQWLASDKRMQQTYQAQLKLSQAMKSLLW